MLYTLWCPIAWIVDSPNSSSLKEATNTNTLHCAFIWSIKSYSHFSCSSNLWKILLCEILMLPPCGHFMLALFLSTPVILIHFNCLNVNAQKDQRSDDGAHMGFFYFFYSFWALKTPPCYKPCSCILSTIFNLSGRLQCMHQGNSGFSISPKDKNHVQIRGAEGWTAHLLIGEMSCFTSWEF